MSGRHDDACAPRVSVFQLLGERFEDLWEDMDGDERDWCAPHGIARPGR